MKNKIEDLAVSWLSIISLMINYFPYILYILLINNQGGKITNALPLAIFYAFRRTLLFVFRDLRKNTNFLGWLGLVSGLIGYFISIFGIFNSIWYDVGAIFVGSAAALFPTSLKQLQKNTAKQQKKTSSGHDIIRIVEIVLAIVVFILFSKSYPILAFLELLFWSILGIIGYHARYGKFTIERPFNVNWKNIILIGIFMVALFLMEAGRTKDMGTVMQWGILLLAIFLIILLLMLIFDRRRHQTRASKKLYLQIMMYGVCGMFWINYSAVFITIFYGADLFGWVFLAYIGGQIIKGPVAKFVQKLSPFTELTTNCLLIILGILGTFWLPTYFVGIFLISVFSDTQKQITMDEYEKETGKSDDIEYLSYYLSSLSAFVSQVIMWGSLIISCSNKGFNQILHALSFDQIASAYRSNINLSHIALAAFMIIFVIITYLVSKQDQIKQDKI